MYVSLNLSQLMGDFILKQKDGNPPYQIASLCDDLHWNINFIVRGQDLLPSTGAQIFLAQQLGYDDFQKATFFPPPFIDRCRRGKALQVCGFYSFGFLAGSRRKPSCRMATGSAMAGNRISGRNAGGVGGDVAQMNGIAQRSF
jgi:hypothetical protein